MTRENTQRNKMIAEMYKPGVRGFGLKSLGNVFDIDHMAIRRILIRYGKIKVDRKKLDKVDGSMLS